MDEAPTTLYSSDAWEAALERASDAGGACRRRRLLPWAALPVALGICVVTWQMGAWADSSPHAASPQRVSTAQVRVEDGTRTLRVHGVIGAASRAVLSFTVPGRLADRSVEIGEPVRAGQVVARLDDDAFENAVRAAQASVGTVQARLRDAQRTRKRAKVLSEVEVASAADVESAEAAVRSLAGSRAAASAQRDEARRLLRESQLRAPFDGTVSEVLVEPGEVIAPGRPVIVLVGDDQLEVEVEVPESELSRVREGMAVEVDLPLAGLHGLEGTVHRVARSATATRRIFPVIVRVEPTEGAVSGMAAEVIFTTKGKPAKAVPISSVLHPDGRESSVLVVRNGTVERVGVEVLDLVGDQVSVEGPISTEDLVIIGRHAGLMPGDQVTPITRATERAADEPSVETTKHPDLPSKLER